MPSYANDFDYSIVGGDARFSYLFTRIFSFRIRIGGIYYTMDV